MCRRVWWTRFCLDGTIGGMGSIARSKLAQTILRGRTAAGSLTLLINALGAPRLNQRTVEKWIYGERVPPEYVAAAVIERIENFLKTK